MICVRVLAIIQEIELVFEIKKKKLLFLPDLSFVV